MKVTCPGCGKKLKIPPKVFQSGGKCPACGQELILTRPTSVPSQGEIEEPSRLGEHFFSGMLALVAHILFFFVLSLIPTSAEEPGGTPEPKKIRIAELPGDKLIQSEEENLQESSAVSSSTSETNELSQTTLVLPSAPVDDLAELSIPSAPGGTSGQTGGGSELGGLSGGGNLGGDSWKGMLQQMRRYGLDITLVFDSTSSMGAEINQVKTKIAKIGKTLFTLVPKTRISIVSYRDKTDAQLVQGLPLVNNLTTVERFLLPIQAIGGGDIPEAVQEGMKWAVNNNRFRKRARKVMLIFGDAPPHSADLAECLNQAAIFRKKMKGIVSTVTCRQFRTLPEFDQIAETGGGESFLVADHRKIMEQLIVLVFGSRHKSKVLEAFRLFDK